MERSRPRRRTLAHDGGRPRRSIRSPARIAHQRSKGRTGVCSMKTSTRCVQLGRGNDAHGAIVPPIYQTATFEQPTASEFGEYDYTRSGNPTRTLLEQQLADLEDARHACAFASGMAALTALTRIVNPGDEIIAGDDLYGGTVRLLDRIASQQNISVR